MFACEDEPSRLIDAWEGADAAVLVDAVDSGAEPGTMHRFDASDEPLPGARRSAPRRTRSASARRSSSRARSAGCPAAVLVYGVEGDEFAAGEGLTAAVEAAVEAVVHARCSSDLRATATRGARMHERALMDDLMRKIEEVARAERRRRA